MRNAYDGVGAAERGDDLGCRREERNDAHA
jgi:hypothetical protein